MQQLSVNLTIPIPEDQVLISKVELEVLEKQSLVGVYWNMKDVEQKTGRKINWLKENLFYLPQFRKILDVENGGFVYYPSAKGQAWSFQANKMAQFLDKHFEDIFRERKR